ncbi:MAG: chitobiase/beta-hexosaminidase C-terminal domain-containing protein [Bacteroidaceae bacterium]|nr:chitobiase/beta-hexosaminidase C-terminal domain-containing protein [Bacteroidaceae bacterium]
MTTKNNTVHATSIAAEAKHNPSCWRRIATLLTLAMTFAWAGAQTPTTLAEGVYTIRNVYNSRGTMCYGKYSGTEYFGMADITLSGHQGKSLTVEQDANKHWYVLATDQGTYIYNLGKEMFLQVAANDVAAVCDAKCGGSFALESRTIGGTAYTFVKNADKYLSFCCYVPTAGAQLRWLAYEAEAAALTFEAVADGTTTYATEIAEAKAAINEYEGLRISVDGWYVSITAEDGATIYYTTDDTEPTEASTPYVAPFSHEGCKAIKAIAVKDGEKSEVVTFTAKSSSNVTCAAGQNHAEVTFTAGENVTYYYTTDGSTPGEASQSIAAGSSQTLSVAGTTVKVVALEQGKLASDVVTVHPALGVAPQVSGATQTYTYRIVNTRLRLDVNNSKVRYLYPLAEQGTYGRWLKLAATGDESATSEQYWYLVDAGDGYRYIVSRQTGEYLYYNTTAVSGQLRFEMSPSHRTKFKIVPSLFPGSDGAKYCSYNIVPADNQGVSFNPHGGETGFIASYGKGDGGSHWYFTDEVEVTRLATPEITLQGQNVVMTQSAGATIRYTTDSTRPTEETGTEYTGEFPHEPFAAGDRILAAAIAPEEVVEVPEGGVIVDTGNEAAAGESLAIGRRGIARSGSVVYSSAVAIKVLEASAVPFTTINVNYTKVMIANGVDDATIYYTLDGNDPTYTSASAVGKADLNYSDCEGNTIKAFALVDGYLRSAIVETSMAYTAIDSQFYFSTFNPAGLYYLTEDITLPDAIAATFTGVLDGCHHTISGLTAPLFGSADGATIKNVVLSGVNITGGTGNVGAIVGTATGATRIYNCGVQSGSVGGGDNVGSIAGKLEGSARVVNCYSFADITGGTTVAGIVGYNGVASTASNLQTLVVNCMYYGDITGGTNVYPIYGGEKISNSGANGINNYNYYRHEAQITPTAYNCALAAEDKYLTRFEFYRHVLNSQRKLSAYYVTGNVNDYERIAKWVLDTEVAQYPILKPWGEYASPINRKPVNVLDTLTVNIQGVDAENGTLAGKALSLPITDVDPATHDYNYYKVQLPYYNDHYTDNYTNNKVVTGWKITAITGGTPGELTTTGDNRYNFADRKCTQKDLFDVSDRVLAQGGFFNVPEGVTGITIEPYWGKAVYLSDRYYDVRYSGATGHGLTQLGETPDTYNGQTVYKTLDAVWEQLGWETTPFDNAIVLVGNYHSYDEAWHNGGNKQFTIMSVDDNRDDEPDYSLYFKTSVRVPVNPVRFDFINHVNLGMAAKEDGRQDMAGVAIFKPKGWFEVTETALALYTEFEYDINDSHKDEAPLILNGGIYEQFCSAFYGSYANKTLYTIVGGNCYFKAYTPGCQSGASAKTNFPPVSILGGEYEEFYLSGVKADVTPVENYNALCYGNGGKIGVFAGAYQEQINGDVIVKVDHLMVDEFYGGGINDKKPILGNINITIDNSHVGVYCGGPKFGNMAEGKTVTTQATGTTFGQFYGAGYGGTSLYRHKHNDSNGQTTYNTAWFDTYSNNRGKYYNTDGSDRGIMVDYEMEHFCYAGGGSVNARFYTNYASLSVAEVRNVTTTLTRCTINGDLYGGGCQGKATGTLVTTLTDCTVNGSAFAGGYSAAVPTCAVMPGTPPISFSTYNTNTGVFTPPVYPDPVAYTWAKANAELVHDGEYISDEEKKEIYTEVDLTDLGTVYGATRMIVNGTTHIAGSVFGGGNMSKVKNGQTEIIIDGAGVVIDDSVFGGGNEAQVVGNTHVHIKNGTVNGNVYGAGNKAEVTGTTDVVIGGGE